MPDKNQLPELESISPTDETVPNLSIRVSPGARTVPAWPPAQQTYRRVETFPAGITLLIIILALALIGSGFGFILYATTAQYRATLHAVATTEAGFAAQTRVAAQIRNQATANAFA